MTGHLHVCQLGGCLQVLLLAYPVSVSESVSERVCREESLER